MKRKIEKMESGNMTEESSLPGEEEKRNQIRSWVISLSPYFKKDWLDNFFESKNRLRMTLALIQDKEVAKKVVGRISFIARKNGIFVEGAKNSEELSETTKKIRIKYVEEGGIYRIMIEKMD